jgi:hypothetical protein
MEDVRQRKGSATQKLEYIICIIKAYYFIE